MNVIKVLLCHISCLALLNTVYSEFFTIMLSSAIGAGAYWAVQKFYKETDKCEPMFLVGDLRRALREQVFGQPLLENFLLNSLQSHFNNDNPPHALSLIFLGSTGTGKNLVSSLIASSIYRGGINSKYVHLLSGRLNFPLESRVNEYQRNLERIVRESVTACDRSIFIFDEIDKMPSGVIDKIKPYMDHHSVHDNVNYKKAVFIFLTNLGGLEINGKYLKLRENGVMRNEMQYSDFERILRLALFEGDGMFGDGDVIRDHVISAFLPFFPLEKQHVVMCIKSEMSKQGVIPAKEAIDQVLSNIDFHMGEWSESGCKRVGDFVAVLPERFRDRRRN